MANNPSFVFSYLPSTKPAVTNAVSPSVYDQSSSFFQSARKALTAPKLTAEQDQLDTLERTKQHLEEYAVVKVKAGMSVSRAEMAQMRSVETALAGLRE